MRGQFKGCDQKFGFGHIHRRHHCRMCGRTVCDKHSKSRLDIRAWDLKEVRVCDPCAQGLREAKVADHDLDLAVDSKAPPSVNAGSARPPARALPEGPWWALCPVRIAAQCLHARAQAFIKLTATRKLAEWKQLVEDQGLVYTEQFEHDLVSLKAAAHAQTHA